MVAFERALDDGADGVELDVRMSQDGELFVSHDELLKTRHGKIALGQLSADQVHHLETLNGAPIPTLKEVLTFQARTGAYLNVELKGDVPAPLWMARQAAELIRRHGGSRILVSSFTPSQIFVFKRRLPQVPVAQLFDLRSGPLGTALRLACSVPGARTCLHAAIKLTGAEAVHPHFELIDAENLQELRQTFSVINCWTVNDPKRAKELASLGVDALICDDPALIVAQFTS